MLSSSRDVLLKLSETTSPQQLSPFDCITLYTKKNRGGKKYRKLIIFLGSLVVSLNVPRNAKFRIFFGNHKTLVACYQFLSNFYQERFIDYYFLLSKLIDYRKLSKKSAPTQTILIKERVGLEVTH